MYMCTRMYVTSYMYTGDIRNTPFKQVVVAAAEGCMAAMAIHKKLTGRKKVKVDWKHDTPEALLLPKE